ncbi:DUF4429 domain-containing protein [uncultured Sphingomonas sp.]|uniref:DUF4429 domain-containing protein n=1 Tax=uncultured Sphingomonas sp. TaxID=158754 RepID=UPI00258A408B|nr:DUF4429 domain-containing protein [uncultured Sphingomonas sp.]
MIFDGFNGGTVELLDDLLVIRRQGLRSALNHGLKGEKRIPYSSITSVQFKEPGMTTGYIQFGIAGGIESRGGVMAATQDENTVLFTAKAKDDFRRLRDLVERRSSDARSGTRPSAAVASVPVVNVGEELTRLADLRDRGVLTDEEFEMQKIRLLSGSAPVQPEEELREFSDDFVRPAMADTASSTRKGRSVGQTLAILGLCVVGVAVLGSISGSPSPTTSVTAPADASEPTAVSDSQPRSGVTAANYARLTDGMRYSEVVRILGAPGEEVSSSELGGIRTVMYQWEGNIFGGNMNAMFQNDKLVTKAQMGLN